MADEKPPVDWETLADFPPLPSKDDKLFTTAEDWWNNACLNYSRDGWTLYALGYKDAADLLVSHVEDGGRSQDTLVYPILFLYRQYLELALKELIRDARILEEIDEPFPKTHRIDELWRICQTLLRQISSDEPIEYLDEIGRLIGEFSKVDPTSMAFRYPEDRDGNPSLPGISNINLRNVKEVIGKIAIILDGASTQIDVYLSNKPEMYGDFYSGDY
jgi:hypothetical protein